MYSIVYFFPLSEINLEINSKLQENDNKSIKIHSNILKMLDPENPDP